MILLQKKSFQGLFLRLQFWINQIIKSLYPQKSNLSQDQEIELHSVQRMVMKSIISFLLFQREIVDNLMRKKVTDQNDFEWQSQIRLLWTGIEPGCRVDCGGWSTYQQNEYLGSQARLIITPLTNRYFIFISAALREKSAVMFKCAPSEQQAGDIFEEFSNICSVPFRRFQCNPVVQMKMMMQYLNGAALASVWVFFEHLDKLQSTQFQAFNKEIQMVQQQFIIAELSANDQQNVSISKASHSQVKNKNMNIHERSQFGLEESSTTNKKIVSQLHSIPQSSMMSSMNQQIDKSSKINKTNQTVHEQSAPFTKAGKICFGVFGSISHSFLINQSSQAAQILSHSQSAFRILALTRPNEMNIFKVLLKQNGFENFEELSLQTFKCIEQFYQIKSDLCSKINPPESLQIHEQLNLRDQRIIAKLAQQMMQQDWQANIQKIKENELHNKQRDVISFQKTKEQKIIEMEIEDNKMRLQNEERLKIERNSLMASFFLYMIQKFTNQWMSIHELLNQKNALLFNEVEKHLEFYIQKCLNDSFQIQSENQQESSLTEEQKELISMAKLKNMTKSSSNIKDKFLLQTGSSSLIHDKHQESKDQEFFNKINQGLKIVTEKLNYDQVTSQLKNCIQFIEYLGRTRGIALIGPTCSGKTSILKIVSNVLNLAFDIKMRTSVINTATYTQDELYGTIEAFSKQNKGDGNNTFSKQGIFQIILDVFEKERLQLGDKEKKRLIQSVFLDSVNIDSTMSESIIDFITKSNKKENMSNGNTRNILDLINIDKQVPEEIEESISITMPNSNVVMFPQNLYVFFEATTLKDSSPSFVSKVGLIVTEEEDINWKNILFRMKNLTQKRHAQFFKEQQLNFRNHFEDCIRDFLEPFLDMLIKAPKIYQSQNFKVKSCILQFFNLFNSVLYRLQEVCNDKKENDDQGLFMLNECERDVIWSNTLLCTIWSFGAPLNKEQRKIFEEQFFNYRRKFNINIGGPGRQRFTLFDIYFDPENLQWDLLQEKLEYKLKLHYDPQYNHLMIPTVEVSQAYFMMDIILGGLKHDDSLDKHFRLLGPSGTSKSIALNTFIKKYSDQYNGIVIPMSCYLTLDKLKNQVESHYVAKRRNQLEPIVKAKKIVFIIDDLHLQSNLKINLFEFLRTWCVSKGYYDIKRGFFKNIGEFGTIMAENSEYRNSYCKAEGKSQAQSRFLFYSNTLYIDEYDFDRYKIFVQHWLTSKMWSTSKIINKYYILMTNTIMSLMDKLKRQEYFHNASFLRLTNFHIFAKFCSNLANYTLISDEPKEIIVQGFKEEDAAANMMVYELMRSFGDRIMIPNHRNAFLLRVVDACKQEFITGNHLTPQYCDQMLLGNYHNRRTGAHIKYLYVNNDYKAVKEEIREKVRKCSNNHFLETFLEAPNGLKEIFRLSRIFFKEMQHLIILGHAGSGMHEYLQLAAILNDGLIFELNVAKFGDPLRFAQVFKQSVLSAVSINSPSYIIINDQQIRDTCYIDYTYNFIINIIKNETCVLMDPEFKQSLIDIEKELLNQNSNRRVTELNNDILFLQALRKIQKNVHIVFIISEHSTYYEWISLFPGLESKCEVIYMDELSSEGYKQLTSEFFQQRDTDNQQLNNANLIKALVEARQISKHKILTIFYSQQMLQYTCNEDFMQTQAGEYVFNSDKKQHGFLYENGVFQIADPLYKQLNYNVPIEISSLYKTRYVMFLELFRFLYDFLSMNLVIRRNYYETFLRKASEFQDFFKDIKSTKSVLHGESNQITYKLASLKDKIQKIQQIIADKEFTISRRQKDINDLEIELKNNKDELNSVIYEKDKNIDDILDHLEKINGTEFSYIISLQSFKPNEQALLDIFAIVVEKDQRIQKYDKKEFDLYFLNREELINLLNDRREFDYDDACFTRIKDYINQYAANDYKDKPLFKQLFFYLMELYRKLNVRNTMSSTFTRIKEIKEQIDSSYFSINYSKQFIEDKKEEMEGLRNKFERIKDQESSLSKRVEEAEISHMRTEHIFQQIEKYTNKIYGKLTDVKRRIDFLLGDCIIMASSVVFLGVFSLKERLQTRKEIYDYINNGCNIKCSPCWNEINPALNNQSKLFKQVIKEYGLKKVIQNHNYSGIISQTIVVEALFSMIFAPACPYLVDPTGELQEFIKNKLLSNLKIKQLYASDTGINSKLESILRSQTFALLNDMNDMSKDIFGLCSDEALIHRLSTTTHNGFDFDYERLQKLKQLHTLGAFHNSYQSVNKRISTHIPEYENLSFYQVQIFSPRFEFTLNKEYQSKATMFVSMHNDAEVIRGDLASAPWVEIKELMLKHFLPESYNQLLKVKNKLKDLDLKKSELNKNFENAFLVANQDTLQNIGEYTQLKQCVEDIRYSQEERMASQKVLQDLLNENNLLNSYSNVLTIMYISLKKLSKVSGDLNYSWKMYLCIIDQILYKIVRDLNSEQNQNNKKNDQSSQSISVSLHGHAAVKSKNLINPVQIIAQGKDILDKKEFTIDEDFFSTVIIPSIYGTVISAIKQYLVPMYNLILSVLISFKKKEITEVEQEYFFKQLFSLKDFHLWRQSESQFIDLDDKVEKTKFYSFKREILKIYPDQGRKVMEYIEKELGQNFTYRNASLNIYGKIFTQHPEFKNLSLMQKINLGFLCPDHEFKSKICQLVYEQLSSIFSFSEEFVKLHHFIKTASWQQPIALFSQNQINIINTVCSIASYYGVGLEVLRTDLPSNDQQNDRRNSEANYQIVDNLQDYSKVNNQEYNKSKLTREAVTYQSSNKRSEQVCDSKTNYDSILSKNLLGVDDKKFGTNPAQEQNPLQMIENCALQGSWVFISTLKFPSFWHKMCLMLENMKTQNKLANTFRVFIDLQGYQHNEIPDSFLFNHSISFYLTDQNNEDMEGFNDVWANILNDKILVDLTQIQYVTFKQQDNEQVQEDHADQDPFANLDGNDQDRAFQQIDGRNITQGQLIKDDKQRELYKDFMRNQMLEESKNNTNTLIFGSEPTQEIIKQKTALSNSKLSEDNLNGMLSDIKSMGTLNSKDKSNPYQNQMSWNNGGGDPVRISLDQQILGQDIDNDQTNKNDLPVVSRINSIHNSMDLSKGENSLIQELKSQFEAPATIIDMRRQDSKMSQVKRKPSEQSQASISAQSNAQKSLNSQNSMNKSQVDQQMSQIQENNNMKFDDITDIEANQAFEEFQGSDDKIENNQNDNSNLNNTSDLI